MLWYVEKKIDNDFRIVYSYGKETREQSGEIEFNKTTEEFTCLIPATGETPKGLERLYPHLYRLIFREGSPARKMIATG